MAERSSKYRFHGPSVASSLDQRSYACWRPTASVCRQASMASRSRRSTRPRIPRRWQAHRRPTTSGPWCRVRRRSGCWCRGSGVGPRIAHLRGNQGDGLGYGPAEFVVWRGHVRERRAQVGTGAATGGADLGDRMVAADDEVILSDNQIHHLGRRIHGGPSASGIGTRAIRSLLRRRSLAGVPMGGLAATDSVIHVINPPQSGRGER
jgi:hypothetical protein